MRGLSQRPKSPIETLSDRELEVFRMFRARQILTR